MDTELIEFNVVVNEVSIKNNNLGEGTFELSPKINRKIGKYDNIEDAYFINIEVTIDDTEKSKSPITLYCSVSGNFILKGDSKNINDFLKIQGFQMLFPHVRSLIANATANMMLPSILIPIVYADKFIDS